MRYIFVLIYVDQFLHRGGALLQRGLLSGFEFDLVNFLDAHLEPSFTGTPTYKPLMPYSPSRYAAHGSTFFLSFKIDSAISTAAAEGA